MANDNNDPNIPSRSNLGQRLQVTQLLFFINSDFGPCNADREAAEKADLEYSI
jgi:hypothetical protein